VRNGAGLETAAEIGGCADHAILEDVEARAIERGIAVLRDELPVLAFLPIGRKLDIIDRAIPFITPVERGTVARHRVVRLKIDHCRRGEHRGRGRRRRDAAQHIGIDDALVIFAGQSDAAVRPGLVDDLAKQRVRLGVLRVGHGAARIRRPVGPHIVELMPVAARICDHRRQVAAAPCHDRGLAELLIRAVIRCAHAAAEILVGADQIDGIAGHETHCASQSIAAVERRGRATKDLDRFHQAEIDIAAAPRGLCAEFETIGHAHAVDLDQHAIAVETANVEARRTIAPRHAQRRAETAR
jgi:hypothetical protein